MDKHKYETALDDEYSSEEESSDEESSEYSIQKLITAAAYGDADIVEAYLRDGMVTENSDKTMALVAAAGGSGIIDTRMLLEDDTHEQEVAMIAEFEKGREKIISLLLDAGVDIDGKDSRGKTALTSAVENGKEKIVSMLLNAGANIETKNRRGYTALHFAVLNGKEKMVSMLLNAGANIETKNRRGYTALHLAVLNGHKGITKALLDAGADPEAEDQSGKTALTRADESNHRVTETILVLLKYGAECPRDGDLLSSRLKQPSFFQKKCREFMKDLIEKARMFYPLLKKNELTTRMMLTEYVLNWMRDEDRRYIQKSESAAKALACYALASALKSEKLICPFNYDLDYLKHKSPRFEPYKKPYDETDPRCRRELYMRAWTAFSSELWFRMVVKF